MDLLHPIVYRQWFSPTPPSPCRRSVSCFWMQPLWHSLQPCPFEVLALIHPKVWQRLTANWIWLVKLGLEIRDCAGGPSKNIAAHLGGFLLGGHGTYQSMSSSHCQSLVAKSCAHIAHRSPTPKTIGGQPNHPHQLSVLLIHLTPMECDQAQNHQVHWQERARTFGMLSKNAPCQWGNGIFHAHWTPWTTWRSRWSLFSQQTTHPVVVAVPNCTVESFCAVVQRFLSLAIFFCVSHGSHPATSWKRPTPSRASLFSEMVWLPHRAGCAWSKSLSLWKTH